MNEADIAVFKALGAILFVLYCLGLPVLAFVQKERERQQFLEAEKAEARHFAAMRILHPNDPRKWTGPDRRWG